MRQPLSLPLAISWRYLRGRRSQLMSGTARAALGSTGLGVTAMVVAMSLMNGYTEDLQGKMLESGAVIITPVGTSERTPEALEDLPEVTDVTFALFAQGSLLSESHPQGVDVYLRGVTPGSGRFGASAEQLSVDADGVSGLVLGADLFERLGLEQGDRVRLVLLAPGDGSSPYRYRSGVIRGTFRTGFSQFDQSYAIVDRSLLEDAGIDGGIYEVAVAEPSAIEEVTAVAEETLGDDFIVRDWRQSNPGLFTALRLQKWGLFLMLGLIVVVSTFNVSSTLIVLVREKMRDVGLLAALGLRPRGLRNVFLLCGLWLGLAGTALGIACGALLCWLFTEFELLRFDPEVAEIYFLSAVPFRLKLGDLTAVAAFAALVTLLATWFPARRAARIDPATALRYE